MGDRRSIVKQSLKNPAGHLFCLKESPAVIFICQGYHDGMYNVNGSWLDREAFGAFYEHSIMCERCFGEQKTETN